MPAKYQYDIAFSVAEEDLWVAKQIAHALKARGIRYYLYAEHYAENLGKTLMQISQEVYGKKARHVLMLTSKVFVTKYWTVIESQIVHVAAQQRPEFIFQVKLDNARVDSISDYLFSLTWNNNPDQIADVIAEKICSRINVWRSKLRQIAITVLSAFFVGLFALNAYRNNAVPMMETLPEKKNERDSQAEGKREKDGIGDKGISPSKKESVKLAPTDFGRKIDKVEITAATFTMGSNRTRTQDSPAHTVSLKSFFISRNEIPLSEYTLFAIATNRPIPAQPTHTPSSNYPVVNITWEDANAFCKWLGGRLPTEAEWEYAAWKNGNGTTDRYSGGDNMAVLGFYETNSSGKAHPVAQKYGGKLGLFDMSGNVAEWCADWYAPYTSTSQVNPLITDSTSGRKVVRGGHYASPVKPDPEGNQLRFTCRESEMPNARKPYIGFRVVWDK